MLRMARLSALVAVIGGLQAYSLPAPPPPPKSPSNVPTGDYLAIEVPSPKASGNATAGEPTTALVPSWVLASDDPAKANHDCTITMEIGYVRKWCVPIPSSPNHKESNSSVEHYSQTKQVRLRESRRNTNQPHLRAGPTLPLHARRGRPAMSRGEDGGHLARQARLRGESSAESGSVEGVTHGK